MSEEVRYQGRPTVNLDDDLDYESPIQLITGSCCYDCRIEELTIEQALELSGALEKMATMALRLKKEQEK